MSTGKLRVGVVFGGRSAEHEISIRSARTVIASLDPEKYEPVLLAIDRAGRWVDGEHAGRVLDGEASIAQLPFDHASVGLVPGEQGAQLIRAQPGEVGTATIDLLFPVLHGPHGEDGSVQGLAKLADIPCVGAGILGSAVGMDKDVMKRLLRDAGIPIAPFVCVTRGGVAELSRLTEHLAPPLFVKPANLGSSVGITRVSDPSSLTDAVGHALRYDRKVVIEEGIDGREMECSVLGNDQPIASGVGEIIATDHFYSYESKYLDESGATLVVPAEISEGELESIQKTSIDAFVTLECAGMARVDGFLVDQEQFVVNEINTIPGFTSISMFPKLFELSGIGKRELVDRLIQLAIERHREESSFSLVPEALIEGRNEADQ